MEVVHIIEREIAVPLKCCRKDSNHAVICLVHENWLQEVQGHHFPTGGATYWDILGASQCQLLLAASQIKVPKPWHRVLIQIYLKSSDLVTSLIEEPLTTVDSSGSVSDLMTYIQYEKKKALLKQARRKYSQAFDPDHQDGAREVTKEYNAVIREVLTRTFGRNFIQKENSNQTIGAADTHSGHPNLLSALALLESKTAFFVVHPYSPYTLRDCITFSPAILSSSHAKPLFILYQILQAIQYCHCARVSVGDLRAKDVFIDDKLWVQLVQPHVDRLYLPHRGNDHIESNCVRENGAVANDPSSKVNQNEPKVTKPLSVFDTIDIISEVTDLSALVQKWMNHEISNFSYLMALNHLAGRRMGDPNHHPVLPWVIDFTQPDGAFRDLTRSKFRLNKGDCQLDLTYDTSTAGTHGDPLNIPHHISDVLSDITYYVYMARRTPKSVLCTHVRPKWVPGEYPASMVRMQNWTPDECIPEFFCDPTIFTSIHDDLPDLEVPDWCDGAEDFTKRHMDVLESDHVSNNLHHWIDLTFGYKLSGIAAVSAKNVCLQLVDKHTSLLNHGVVQLFKYPHPQKVVKFKPDEPYEENKINSLPVTNGIQETHGSSPTLTKKENTSNKSPSTERRRSQTEVKAFSPRLENTTIKFPHGFQPLANLEQVEDMFKFSLTANRQLPPAITLKEVKTDKRVDLMWRDMQALGCLIAEIVLSSHLRGIHPKAHLAQRYDIIRKTVAIERRNIPRPLRRFIEVILEPHREWKASSHDNSSALFEYEFSTPEGIPAPSPGLLLHPHISLVPFPPYFPALHRYICRMKHLDQTLDTMPMSDSVKSGDCTVKYKSLAREKVTLTSKCLVKLLPQLNAEGVDLVIPFVLELFDNPVTSVQAAWMLFCPVAQTLGPAKTAHIFLPYLVKLYDAEESTPKHMKLYHRTFILQLIIRLGIKTFLANFSTLLVEAVAAYKDFICDDTVDRQISNDGYLFPPISVNGFSPQVVNGSSDAQTELGLVEEEDSVTDQTEEESRDEDTYEETPHVSEADDEFVERMSLEGQEEEDNKRNVLTTDLDDESGDDNMIAETDYQCNVITSDTLSICSEDISEDSLSRSVGRLSVHSLSRLVEGQRDRSPSESSQEGGDSSASRRLSGVSVEGRTEAEGEGEEDEDLAVMMNGDDEPLPNMVRSETEEFKASIMDSAGNIEYNISDVSAETIKWLSHRLGPVLVAKNLTRNLLRMMELCYLGEEQYALVTVEDDKLRVSGRHLAGDRNASRVLECLSFVAALYGEQLILLQYLPYYVELVSVAQKRMTVRAEAGIVACLSFLYYIIPFLQDSTLMDILQDTILNDITLPLLRLTSSLSLCFPTGSHSRKIVLYRIIDIIYLIGLRIGFEMTRKHMSFALQRFFASFDRVFGPHSKESEDEGSKVTQSVSAEESAVKKDIEPNEKNGLRKTAQTQQTETSSHRRSDSGSLRHSLSPPKLEENEEVNGVSSMPKEKVILELKETFTAELAHTAYIPFCKLAGGIHMEQTLINDDLIRHLVAEHDEVLNSADVRNQCASPHSDSDRDAETPTSGQTSWFVNLQDQENVTTPDTPTGSVVSGGFGKNVMVEGNKIVIHESSPSPPTESAKKGKLNDSASIDYSKLKSSEMDVNKQRHLKGNWLAYWEHELGLNERGALFNFKQIKLQTFCGHSNSVRSLYALNNENSFISASKDKTVKLWSLRNFSDGTGRVGCQYTYRNHKKSVFTVTFLESLRLAASCDSSVHIWDPFIGMSIRQFESPKNSPVTVLTPMPAPHTTIITGTTESTLRFLDVRASSYLHEVKCSTVAAGLIRCLTVSPDSNWVAVGYSTGVISVLDVRTGLLIASWKGHEGEILQIKAYNSGSFVTSSFDQMMSLWSAEDGKLLCHFRGPTEPVHCFSFYKNEVISATTANRIGVHTSMDANASFSSTKLRSDAFRGVLTTMTVLPMNRLLLLGADNGTIRLLC